MTKNTILLLIFGVISLIISACGTSSNTPQSPTIYFEPTPAPQITTAPLILTPVLSPEPLPTIPPLSGESQSSKSMALNDNILVTVNSDSDSVTLIDIDNNRVITEIHVGDDPRTVAITPDGQLALITLRGDNALAVVNLKTQQLAATYPTGHMPYGVVTDGNRAFVSNFADDQLAVLHLETGEILYKLDVHDAPTGLALSDNWLFVTHFYNGFVTLVNLERRPFIVGRVNAEPDGNLARAIVIAPDGQRAYIPQTRTGLSLISLQFMQDWFPVVSVLDTTNMIGNRDERITISMMDDYAANMPFDVAFSPDGQTLFIVLAGNDRVLAVDTSTNTVRARIAVEFNPRGAIATNDLLFILNTLSGTVSVIDTATFQTIDTITVTENPLDPQILQGKILFHRATEPVMSDGAISCATCHFDGGMDARTWINFRSGPRNTSALGGAAALPPYNWGGDMNELHDTTEDQIRHVMLGDGLIDGPFDATTDDIDAGRSEDLDALVAYMTTFEPWPSPYRNDDGTLSESAQRGMEIFMSSSPNCSCHAPPLYTDMLQHNIPGAAFSFEIFGSFDTPTLRGIWATAPYMHDGIAQSLEELLTRTDPVHSVAGNLTEQQLYDLIAFLLSL
jgi:YVTN family beta-propeller protein